MSRRLLAIGALIILGLMGAAAIVLLYAYPEQPKERVWAQVTRVGLNETRWRHDAVVVFATTEGLTGEAIISSDVFSCRVGDTVEAVKRGVSVSLKPSECKAGASKAK